MNRAVREEIAKVLGSRIDEARPVGGGDINEAHAVTLRDGRCLFVKTNDAADPSMFACEAHGLAWLREANALRVPDVVASSPRFLVLEHVAPGRRAPDFAETLGRGLAALHRVGADGFGFREDNFVGSLPQDNGAEPDWPTFYVRRRLEPLLARAAERGLATGAMRRGFDRLFVRMPELAGPPEPPARLHGDLWGGNCHVAEDGAPVLIDPAVYGGHREIDLAMMLLFGGFSESVLDAYDEAYPLEQGWRERVPLYQLYPLMVHVSLFGGGYVGSVERALSRYA